MGPDEDGDPKAEGQLRVEDEGAVLHVLRPLFKPSPKVWVCVWVGGWVGGCVPMRVCAHACAPLWMPILRACARTCVDMRACDDE